ncbi:Hint domain-containing protein [Rhodobacter capsulatus]|uniref:Hint domain-containing protein n=1 Tax=Rhodobacter capsulatus TaxID=1061 RepID=UPI0040292F01
MPIDWLRPGDRVLTRDNGYQPLLWVGQHTMPRRAPPETRPLLLAAACFGEALPERDVLLSPGAGVLLAGHELELWFGESEMFAKARHALPKAEAGAGPQSSIPCCSPPRWCWPRDVGQLGPCRCRLSVAAA